MDTALSVQVAGPHPTDSASYALARDQGIMSTNSVAAEFAMPPAFAPRAMPLRSMPALLFALAVTRSRLCGARTAATHCNFHLVCACNATSLLSEDVSIVTDLSPKFLPSGALALASRVVEARFVAWIAFIAQRMQK